MFQLTGKSLITQALKRIDKDFTNIQGTYVAYSEPIQGLPGVYFISTSPSSVPSMWLTQPV